MPESITAVSVEAGVEPQLPPVVQLPLAEYVQVAAAAGLAAIPKAAQVATRTMATANGLVLLIASTSPSVRFGSPTTGVVRRSSGQPRVLWPARSSRRTALENLRPR